MNYRSYIIRCLTNMHAGSGDNNFGVVDNMVQRDAITESPTIHSSSFKGALRSHFGESELTNYIFGSAPDAHSAIQGKYRFFSSHLLCLPVRSNFKSYFLGTTISRIKDFIQFLDDFNISSTDRAKFDELVKLSSPKPGVVFVKTGEGSIEGLDVKLNENIPIDISIFTGDLAIFSDEDFKDITKSLPVIARNYLEDGVSKNLWYEEVVPRESLFYTVIGFADEYREEFEKELINNMIQIGGNASIGYGVTKILQLGKSND